jgi:hypothetical protein
MRMKEGEGEEEEEEKRRGKTEVRGRQEKAGVSVEGRILLHCVTVKQLTILVILAIPCNEGAYTFCLMAGL